MKNLITSVITILLIIFSVSCRKDFSTIPSTGNLTFSKDTVFLDTIFTNISSSTYGLKVYNNSNENIHIPSIRLGRGSSSFYRLTVDGTPEKNFEDVLLLAKDSMYILVEATIDYSKVASPLYTDSIVFDSDGKLQDVKLVTLVQDATFIFPPSIDTEYFSNDSTLDGNKRAIRRLTDSELTFTNEKPYVIYGYCVVSENKTLTIESGAKLYFHDKSALVVEKNASIIANGTLDEKIYFEGDRLEHDYSDIPGQWDAIWFYPESVNNELNNVVIKNATIGIRSESEVETPTAPTLTLKNTEVYNSAEYGVHALHTSITGENLVLGSSGVSSLKIENGGTYNFVHATFANYWNKSARFTPTIDIANTEKESVENTDLKEANFTNSIIDGSNSDELSFNNNETNAFNFFFKNCMIKHHEDSTDPLYDFTDETLYKLPVLNGNSDFKNPVLNEYFIGENSEAINKADGDAASEVPLDLIGTDRTLNPDIGAYQNTVFETEQLP